MNLLCFDKALKHVMYVFTCVMAPPCMHSLSGMYSGNSSLPSQTKHPSIGKNRG